jgi:hypothetical protein
MNFTNFPTPSTSLTYRTSNQLTQFSTGTNDANLGYFSSLPMEIILMIFSRLQAQHLLRVSLLNRAFYWISQEPNLWKKLTLDRFPNFVPSDSVIDWKTAYKREPKDGNNFLLFRQRTCSSVADIVPSRNFLTRARALTATPITHYFSFDKKGKLQAIFYEKNVKKVYNVYGRIQEMREEDWNVKASIHRQFIFLSFFDGRHPFVPQIKLEPVGNLNAEQQAAVYHLQKKIDYWFEQTIKAADLDEQVKQAMVGHYNPTLTNVSAYPGEAAQVTAQHKAYFVFLRGELENPLFEMIGGFFPPTFFTFKNSHRERNREM